MTICPRRVPVSAASASLCRPLIGFHSRDSCRAYQAVPDGRAGQDSDRIKASAAAKLTDAARGEPRLMGEVPVPNVASERAHRVGHPGDEDAARDLRAAATESNVSSTSSLVRCSSRSVADDPGQLLPASRRMLR